MSSSGGSSPFVESPIELESKEVQNPEVDDDVSAHNNSNKRSNLHFQVEEKDRQIISLEFKLSTLKNEFELERLQLQRQSNNIDKKYRTTIDELEKALNDTRYLQESNDKLVSEISDLKKKMESVEAENVQSINELKFKVQNKEQELENIELKYETELAKLDNELEGVKIENSSSKTTISRLEDQLSKHILELKELTKANNEKENEIAELKTNQMVNSHQTYNSEELRELTTLNNLFQDQIKYTKELEEANIKQANELKKLRNATDSNNFWKLENEKLQVKLTDLETVEQQLQNSQVEVLDLKAKLASWEIYQSKESDFQMEDSESRPAEIIRDWKLTKKENLLLVDENSKLNLSVNNLKVLNEELALERNQILDLNKDYESNIINLKKLNHELEQQKLLSFEECKLLRRQLDDLSEVNKDSDVGKIDESNIQKNFESLIDEYKNKTDDLTNELKKMNEDILSQQESNGNALKKRKANDSTELSYYSNRINELQLENANLSRGLQKFQNLNKLLDEKLKKLITLKEKKIRILQLRDNPLSKDQFIKKKEIEILRDENRDLLDSLKGTSDLKSIPISVYNSLNFDLKQKDGEIFKLNKRFMRLKEIFNKKSLEFIDVVNSILGFKLEFMPGDKVKIYSCFKSEKYIIVDLVKNTLTSNLDIDNWDASFKLWIQDREQIPCFLASLTLQLWDATNEQPQKP